MCLSFSFIHVQGTFPWIFHQEFQLPDSEIVSVIVYGKSLTGFKFQRQIDYYIIEGSLHSPAYFFSEAFDSCIYGNLTNTGNCFCFPGFVGESCDNPLCFNEGSSINGICMCKSGYFGQFCEKGNLFDQEHS